MKWYDSSVVTLSLEMSTYMQRVALHELSFVTAAENASLRGGEAYTKLTLDILYSLREFFGAKKADNPKAEHNVRLARWLRSEGGITNNKEDRVEHWAQLVVALALAADAEVPKAALFSLVLEIAHRKARLDLKFALVSHQDGKAALRKQLCELLRVSPSTSPQPSVIGLPDLALCEVEGRALQESLDSLDSLCLAESAVFVDLQGQLRKILERAARSLFFVEMLRGVLAQRGGGWEALKTAMETGQDRPLVKQLAEKAKNEFPGVEEYFGLSTENVGCIALYSEYRVSSTRRVEQDGLPEDPAGALVSADFDLNGSRILSQISAGLKMDFYSEALKLKQEEIRKDSSAHVMLAAMACLEVEEFERLVVPERTCKVKGEHFGRVVKRNAHSGKDPKTFMSLAKAAYEKSLAGDSRFMESFDRLTKGGSGSFYSGKKWKRFTSK
jgi:hypothetical protein